MKVQLIDLWRASKMTWENSILRKDLQGGQPRGICTLRSPSASIYGSKVWISFYLYNTSINLHIFQLNLNATFEVSCLFI